MATDSVEMEEMRGRLPSYTRAVRQGATEAPIDGQPAAAGNGPGDSSGRTNGTEMAADAPVTLTFIGLNYIIERPMRKLSCWDKVSGLSLRGTPNVEMERVYLIRDATGAVSPNTMTALMGPSGAGKSTLLDLLAGRKTTGTVEGQILFNGVPRTPSLKRTIGYVEQTDMLLGTVTVRELLMYTARFKLPATLRKAELQRRVQEVIEELDLGSCADSTIGTAQVRGISGGQAKRVNIGIELITQPRVLFLDEPTTGLDSATAHDVMSICRQIANRGRTLLVTIHQPSTDVFLLFNRLLLLVKGEIVYFDDAQSAVGYFERLGFRRNARDMNPAEFIGTPAQARTQMALCPAGVAAIRRC